MVFTSHSIQEKAGRRFFLTSNFWEKKNISFIFLAVMMICIYCNPLKATEKQNVSKQPSNQSAEGEQVENRPILNIKSLPHSFEYYEDIYTKNLFHAERKLDDSSSEKAEEEKKDHQAKDTVKLPNLRLIGTLSIGKEKRFAYIIDSKSKTSKNKTEQYKVGDYLGEYCISEIRSDRVILTKESEVAVIRLKPVNNKRNRRYGNRSSRGKDPRRGGRSSGTLTHRGDYRSREKENEKYSAPKRKGGTNRSYRGRGSRKTEEERTKRPPNKSLNENVCGGSSGRKRASPYSCGN